MNLKSANWIYHVLGLLFFIVPLVGMAAPLIFYYLRFDKTQAAWEHAGSVIRFEFSLFIYFVISFVFFPGSVAQVMTLILSAAAAICMLLNAWRVHRGEEPYYPFSLPIGRKQI